MVPVFKNIGEMYTAKNYRPVSFLPVVSKVFEKLFPDFQYDFTSFRSTVDLLTVVSDGIARAFNKSGATRAVAFVISKAFDRFLHAGLLHKLMEFKIRYLALFLFFSVMDGFELFWMEGLHKNI